MRYPLRASTTRPTPRTQNAEQRMWRAPLILRRSIDVTESCASKEDNSRKTGQGSGTARRVESETHGILLSTKPVRENARLPRARSAMLGGAARTCGAVVGAVPKHLDRMPDGDVASRAEPRRPASLAAAALVAAAAAPAAAAAAAAVAAVVAAAVAAAAARAASAALAGKSEADALHRFRLNVISGNRAVAGGRSRCADGGGACVRARVRPRRRDHSQLSRTHVEHAARLHLDLKIAVSCGNDATSRVLRAAFLAH
eukprot:6184042-Pleurochrysis_carterae.AAC.2